MRWAVDNDEEGWAREHTDEETKMARGVALECHAVGRSKLLDK